MSILTDRDREAVKKEFEKLTDPVKVIVFSQELGSETCQQTEWLVKDVVGLTDKASVEVLNLILDREKAEAYGVDRVPALVVEGAKDYGLRFFGIPAGYEFTNLIDAMVVASTGKPALSEETRAALAGLTSPVHIKVFTTPT
jgi:alkyl hydroperoxide reductase subunit AhpF